MTLTASDARQLHADLARDSRLWKAGYSRGVKVRRDVFLASFAGAAWLIVVSSRRHVALRAAVFYGLALAGFAVLVLSPLIALVVASRAIWKATTPALCKSVPAPCLGGPDCECF
jgi:hypothetical protein